MFWVRFSKAVLAMTLGVWVLLVVFGNLTDYDTNWSFVQKVMEMEAVEDDPNVNWRAVENPTLHHLAYAAIILAEAVQGVLFLLAGILMTTRLRGSLYEFRAAKRPFAIGLTVAVVLWLFGFMAIAGEWFQMWRSSNYNVQSTVFMYYMTIILSGVFILQEADGEAPAQ